MLLREPVPFLFRAAALFLEARLFGVGAEARDLVLRAQPTDLAGLLLYGALLVERDEPPQDLLVRKRRRPAIGLEDELIQPLVQFLQDENEALVLDALVFGVEGRARLQLFEHVVHLRERQAGMLRLPRLAVRVQFFGGGADASLDVIAAIGEGKGIEAAGFRIAHRADAKSNRQRGAPISHECAMTARRDEKRLRSRSPQACCRAELNHRGTEMLDALMSLLSRCIASGPL